MHGHGSSVAQMTLREKSSFCRSIVKENSLLKYASHIQLVQFCGLKFELLKSTFNTAGYLGLSSAISAYFAFKMCAAAYNRKTSYFGGSSSFKVINVGTTGKLVSSTCYNKQHYVFGYLHLFFTLDKSIEVK